MKKLLAPLLLALSISMLPACVPAAFMAGTAAGGAIIYDKRSVPTMVQDRDMANEALKRIMNDPDLNNHARIAIASFDQVLLMVGQAPTEQLRDRAYQLVSSVPKVKRIYNEVTIGPPISTKQQATDSWLTTKAKSAMLAERGLKSSQIKVVTENNIVYLMGIVTRKQADLAATAASHVTGVAQVVKVFEYEQ